MSASSRECLKAISSVKTKTKKEEKFSKQFLSPFRIYTGLGYFIRTAYQFNSQSMGRPDKRKAEETHGLLGKKRIPWNKPIAGVLNECFLRITIT